MGILRTDKISGLEKEKGQNPNLVANGDFSEASIDGWKGYNAVISYDSGAGGRIKVDDSANVGGWSNAAYVINTEPGASYRFEVRASATDDNTHFIGYYQGTYDTAGTEPTVYSSSVITPVPAVRHFDLIATGTTVTIMLIANNNGVVYFDDVSFRKTDGNPIGGSVHFDGTGDRISVPASSQFAYGTGDFTIEAFVYLNSLSASYYSIYAQTVSGTNYLWIAVDTDGTLQWWNTASGGGSPLESTSGVIQTDTWHHIAICRSGSTLKGFVDGNEVMSQSNTFDFSNTDRNPSIGNYTHATNQTWNGYISNVRVLKGTALYTSDFTPPTHALEVIGDTVLLCCNNPDSAGAEATGKTITVTGNAAASTVSPGLIRDFTSGTEFKGVTTFDTQGYFVPPSGTTEQRGRGRGLFGGGDPGTAKNNIDYITISSMGNAQDFGDLTEGRLGTGAVASSTRAVFAGGYGSPGNKDTMDFVTIASTGNAVSFGELVGTDRHELAGASNSTRGLFAGGTPIVTDIDYITIASLGDATDFGNLTLARRNATGVMSPTRAVFCGGRNDTPAPSTQQEEVDYVTIATTGNALDFGDLTVARGRMGSVCSSIRGVIAGGEGSPADSLVIDFITIATTGNAQDFGDLSEAAETDSGGCSNGIRGVFGGVTTVRNTMEYVTISSTGNAQDFGDTTYSVTRKTGCSDSHGGIS